MRLLQLIHLHQNNKNLLDKLKKVFIQSIDAIID